MQDKAPKKKLGCPGCHEKPSVIDHKLKEFKEMESKYNNAQLDSYLMGI